MVIQLRALGRLLGEDDNVCGSRVLLFPGKIDVFQFGENILGTGGTDDNLPVVPFAIAFFYVFFNEDSHSCSDGQVST